MGKETDLIKAVKNNDKSKLQKLFLPEGDYKVCKSATAGGGIRMKLRHINVDCQEPSTGYTPLILAILHGHKDVADSLIFYAADVNATDSKGNTPLHMAVFSDRADMADVLLRNKAQVNLQNSDGNTPLHIACQNHASSNVLLLLKLLQAGSDLSLENKAGLSPLELASMFNMKATVSAILDHSPGFLQSEKNTKCITEAAIRGHSQIVETLLDYGCDPNVVHPSKQTRPLPEAVRFFRTGVVKILLEFGAKPDLLSADMMNAVMVAKTLPAGKPTEFLELFKEFAGKPPRVPKYLSEEGNGLRDVPAYPLLPQQPEWTKNTPDFCNSCMAANPNTNLLDGNERSFWVVPSVQGAWTVFDMGHPHTITGLRIWGWDSLQMVKMLELQKGASLKGPWSTVSLLRCRREGSTSPNDPGVAQDFRSFVDTSRFWRLLIVDNHGGKCSCFQGVQFYGADDRIAQVLQKHDLQTAVDSVIVKGSNTFEGFVMMSQKELSDILADCSKIGGLMTELSHLRLLVYPLTKLSWLQAPVTVATEGKSIPEFSVQSDPRVTEEIELVTEGSEVKGQTKVTLQAAGPKEPSIATFSGVVFNSVGSVVVSARSVRFPHISVTPAHCLEVRCAARDKEDIAAAFEDIEAMLHEARISLETPQEEFSVAEINWS